MPGFQNLYSLYRMTAVFKAGPDDREIPDLHPNLIKFITGLKFGTNGADSIVRYDYLGSQCMASGNFILQVKSAYRSFVEQQVLFLIGRGEGGSTYNDSPVTHAMAGQSFHNYYLAVDMCIINPPDGVSQHDAMIESGIVKYAQYCGLRWGGNFVVNQKPFDDPCHFETYQLPKNRIEQDSGWWKNGEKKPLAETLTEITQGIKTTGANINKYLPLVIIAVLAVFLKNRGKK